MPDPTDEERRKRRKEVYGLEEDIEKAKAEEQKATRREYGLPEEKPPDEPVEEPTGDRKGVFGRIAGGLKDPFLPIRPLLEIPATLEAFHKDIIEPGAGVLTSFAQGFIPGEQEIERKAREQREQGVGTVEAARRAFTESDLPSARVPFLPFAVPLPGGKSFQRADIGVKGGIEALADPLNLLFGAGALSQAGRRALRSVGQATSRPFRAAEKAAAEGAAEFVRKAPVPLKRGEFTVPQTKPALELAPQTTAAPAVVAKITTLIKNAKPIREGAEAVKSAEVKRRVAVAAKAGEAADPLVAAEATKRHLAGGLPKAPNFEPAFASMQTEDVRSLFRQIWTTPKEKLPLLSKLDTDTALKKIGAGEVPTRSEIHLLERTFGREFAEAVRSQMSLGQSARELALDIINIPRALVTSFDASAPLRQGIVLAAGHPIRFTQNVKTMFKAMLREKNARAIEEAMVTGEHFALYKEHGLAITRRSDVGTPLAAREEPFMSGVLQTTGLPVLKQIGQVVRISERGYVTFLNKMRYDVMDDVYRGWLRAEAREGGKKILTRDIQELALFVNRATGRGGLGPLENSAPILNSVFFSARLQASRFLLPFSLIAVGRGSESAGVIWLMGTGIGVRKLVAKDLAAFVGTGVGILSLLKLSGQADVNVDPRSSDFGKIKIGQTRLDFWGGFQPIARLAAQAITMERQTLGSKSIVGLNLAETIGRFIRSKLGPPASLATDIIGGRTFLGEELKFGRGTFKQQAYERLVPFFIQDLVDAIDEQGLTGAAMASPGGFGINVQSFSTVDDVSQRDFGVPFTELWPFERGIVSETYKAEADRPAQGYFAQVEKLENTFATNLAGVAEDPSMTIREKRNAYFSNVSTLFDKRSAFAEAAFGPDSREDNPDDPDPQKAALAQYHIAQSEAERFGDFDSDAWNTALFDLKSRWSRDQLEYVQANTHTAQIPEALLEVLPAQTQTNIRDSQAARDRQLDRRGYR